ncbi:MAG: PCYCGC motif-containing (lipo)protein, partial [Exiguobacterium indicum]
CGTCLDIAAQSIVAYQKGSSVKEIRTAIDQAYKKTGVIPTPTPAL